MIMLLYLFFVDQLIFYLFFIFTIARPAQPSKQPAQRPSATAQACLCQLDAVRLAGLRNRNRRRFIGDLLPPCPSGTCPSGITKCASPTSRYGLLSCPPSGSMFSIFALHVETICTCLTGHPTTAATSCNVRRHWRRRSGI